MGDTLDLGPVDCIPPGEGRAFDLGARRVAVFRMRDGGVYATQAACPHREGPLADGLLGGRSVVCPLHGYKFDVVTGAAVGHACGNLTTYPVSLGDDGRMRLLMAESAEDSGARPVVPPCYAARRA
jgi:nitrite reductase (NADH) small subunit